MKHAKNALIKIASDEIELLILEWKKGNEQIFEILKALNPRKVGKELEKLELYENAQNWYDYFNMEKENNHLKERLEKENNL